MLQRQAPRRVGRGALLLALQLALLGAAVTPAVATAAVGSSQLAARRLQQVPSRVLPRFFIAANSVKTSVTNTYSWSITRTATSSGVSVKADGASRQQIGYTLTFTRQLVSQQFVLAGEATITNTDTTGIITVQSITLVIGGRTVTPQCRTTPAASVVIAPGATVACPFSINSTTVPLQSGSIAAYVATTIGRKPADPVPFSFAGCLGGNASTSGGAADQGTAAPCQVRDVGGCASVTDGSYLNRKTVDPKGATSNVTISRSQLFGVAEITPARQGGPRVEPTLPPAAAPAQAGQRGNAPYMPDATWWTGGRRRALAAGTSSGISVQRRRLQQGLPISLTGSTDASFNWPIPQVTGNRPPVGLNGVPANARDAPVRVCSTKVFQYSMLWGPLLPAACGTYEVQNMAAALPDASSKAVTATTYIYLQVLC